MTDEDATAAAQRAKAEEERRLSLASLARLRLLLLGEQQEVSSDHGSSGKRDSDLTYRAKGVQQGESPSSAGTVGTPNRAERELRFFLREEAERRVRGEGAAERLRTAEDRLRAGGIFLEHYIRLQLGMEERDLQKQGQSRDVAPYYHCKANCQSASLGDGVALAAYEFSEARERFDTMFNIAKQSVGLGMSPADKWRDSRCDMKANFWGLDAGTSGLRCESACLATMQGNFCK